MSERPVDDVRRSKDGFYRPGDDVPQERAILVGVHLLGSRPGSDAIYADLDELERLADTAGATIVGHMEQRKQSPNVRSLMGAGKVEQLKTMVETLDANLVIFDNDLTPAQGRNLERFLGVNVIDRTELILDIFARHARTQQARLQVSLAQLEYLLPRLARMWSHLERQAGGIGSRGPGETQIETDRRMIRHRITQLRRELKRIDLRMQTQHKQRSSQFRVSLVGYTNAGKSSLMNRITRAGVYVQDQLFATLDATTRRVEADEVHGFLLTDTVGFIRKLPHHLVESFRATLSEVTESDLLLHVIDASDPEWISQVEAVEDVLRTLGNSEQEHIYVMNKVDQLDPEIREQLRAGHPDGVLTSAHTGEGIDELLEQISDRLRREERRLIVRLSSGDGRGLAALHELGEVQQLDYEDDVATITLRVDSENYGRVLKLDGLEVLEVRGRG